MNHVFKKIVLIIFALVTTVGSISSASADCFEYRYKNNKTIIKNMKQVNPEPFVGDLHRGKRGVKYSNKSSRLYYPHSVWIPKNGYLVVVLAAEFEPEIIIDNGKRNLVYSWSKGKKGSTYYAAVHLSGVDAHRNSNGDVNVNITPIRHKDTGRFKVWMHEMKYSNSNNTRFVAYNKHDACESSVQTESSGNDYNNDLDDGCGPGMKNFLGGCIRKD